MSWGDPTQPPAGDSPRAAVRVRAGAPRLGISPHDVALVWAPGSGGQGKTPTCCEQQTAPCPGAGGVDAGGSPAGRALPRTPVLHATHVPQVETKASPPLAFQTPVLRPPPDDLPITLRPANRPPRPCQRSGLGRLGRPRAAAHTGSVTSRTHARCAGLDALRQPCSWSRHSHRSPRGGRGAGGRPP